MDNTLPVVNHPSYSCHEESGLHIKVTFLMRGSMVMRMAVATDSTWTLQRCGHVLRLARYGAVEVAFLACA